MADDCQGQCCGDPVQGCGGESQASGTAAGHRHLGCGGELCNWRVTSHPISCSGFSLDGSFIQPSSFKHPVGGALEEIRVS